VQLVLQSLLFGVGGSILFAGGALLTLFPRRVQAALKMAPWAAQWYLGIPGLRITSWAVTLNYVFCGVFALFFGSRFIEVAFLSIVQIVRLSGK
jgi:hypothetical protein